MPLLELDGVEAYYGEAKALHGVSLTVDEQQMLALARALVMRPRLLLLDEPSLGLAPRVVGEFFGIVRTLTRDTGLSVLVVEQNARVALASTTHAYVLEVGTVAFQA